MSIMSAIHRIYPPASDRTSSAMEDASNGEAALLRRELVLVRAERERERMQLQERIDDLARRLDSETEERRKLMAWLADDRERGPSTRPAVPVAAAAMPLETLPGLTREQKQFFEDNGYLILEGFFDTSQIGRLKARFDGLWAERGPDCPLVVDCLRTGARIFFRDADESIRTYPYKLNDIHFVDPVIQDFSLDSRLVAILTDLLGHPPVVCNTLMLERGSQQDAHFDTFFMPSITPNMMCATWIAIDPVTETNGPLFYYPKSHLIEPYRFSNGGLNVVGSEMPLAQAYMKRMIEEYGLEEVLFYPKAGDVLIWHAQLLHGGSPIKDMKETRNTLVTHYFTTLDHPNPSDRIEISEGRYLLKKPHLTVVDESQAARIDAFVRGLTTPAEHLIDLPPGFDPRTYLQRNIEVFHAGVDPYTHYQLHGRQEGRVW
jgi:phytanoyl-CoA hydroxylase